VEQKPQKQQLKLQEGIFIQSDNQKKIEFFVLKILFMEEQLLLFMQVVTKK
jgi:hypothetical protein